MHAVRRGLSTMRGRVCICNSQRSLYRAIVGPRPVGEAPRQSLSRHAPSSSSSSPPRPPPTFAAPYWPAAGQLRLYVSSTRSLFKSSGQGKANRSSEDGDDPDKRGYDKRFTTQRDIDRSGRDRPPWDHEITDPQIMVIDKGVAEGPLSTRYVLTKLENGESLRMISPYVPADAEESRDAQFAVCKIVNKRDEYERQKLLKEKKKQAAATKVKTKELELTWAIGPHDLATKLRQMGGFLGKGMKVEVTVGKKKGGRQADAEEAREVLKKLREEVDVLKAREVKPAEGQLGGTMRLYLEGKRPQ